MTYYKALGCILLTLLVINVESFVFSRQWHVRMPTLSRMSSVVDSVSTSEIYIGGLPSEFESSDLNALLADKVPGISSVTVHPYQHGVGKYGFLEFKDSVLFMSAFQKLKTIENITDVWKRQNRTTLMVDVGHWSVNQAELKNNISVFLDTNDTLKSLRMFNRRGKVGAFLEFDTPEEAQRASFLLRPVHINSVALRPQIFVDNFDCNLYVGNLDPSLTHRQVHDLLAEIVGGPEHIKSLKIPPFRSSKSFLFVNAAVFSDSVVDASFAFVEFFTEEVTQKAISELPFYKILNRSLKVDMAKYSYVGDDPNKIAYIHNVDLATTSLQMKFMIEDLLKQPGVVLGAAFDQNRYGTYV